MKFYFFSKLFKVKGSNNATDSKNVSINDNDHKLSTYCKRMINKLMEENDKLVSEKEVLFDRNTKLIQENYSLQKENTKLKSLLKEYIE